MADNTPFYDVHTRTWWSGKDADKDIHIEAYEGMVDGSFKAKSLFRDQNLSNQKDVQNQTNAYRFDRIGGVEVKGRKHGEKLEPERIVNDKDTIIVDRVAYARTVHDFQDDWTAPDFQSAYSEEHGSAHAKAYDTAHIIQLIKASQWEAPDDLKDHDAFHDGIFKELDGFDAEDKSEGKADIIVNAHKDLIADFINRDLGNDLSEFVTLVTPEFFNTLLDHEKLMNVDFQGSGNGNSFAQRRIAYLNGQPITETPRFPTEENNNHFLGDDFSINEEESNTGLVMFHPRQTLITVNAHPMTVRYHDDETDWESFLTSFQMYNVGIRRGDACGALYTDEASE